MKKLFFLCIIISTGYVLAIATTRFEEIDTNNDGFISWEEFQVAMPNITRIAFDTIDSNKDGKISREEWEKFQHSHHKDMHTEKTDIKPLVQPPKSN